MQAARQPINVTLFQARFLWKLLYTCCYSLDSSEEESMDAPVVYRPKIDEKLCFVLGRRLTTSNPSALRQPCDPRSR